MLILIDPHFSKRDISMFLQYWSESDELWVKHERQEILF